MTDALGNPLDFILTGGQVHDNQQAQALLADKETENVLADKAYDSDETIEFIEGNLNACAVIPSKANRIKQRPCDWHVYKERHLIECFIGKLKQFRRVFSRFDKLAHRFLSFIHLASTLIWLR